MSWVLLRGKGKPFPNRGVYAHSPEVGRIGKVLLRGVPGRHALQLRVCEFAQGRTMSLALLRGTPGTAFRTGDMRIRRE